jgi:hypothetical protein
MNKRDGINGFQHLKEMKKQKEMQEEMNEAIMKYSIKKSMDDASKKG